MGDLHHGGCRLGEGRKLEVTEAERDERVEESGFECVGVRICALDCDCESKLCRGGPGHKPPKAIKVRAVGTQVGRWPSTVRPTTSTCGCRMPPTWMLR